MSDLFGDGPSPPALPWTAETITRCETIVRGEFAALATTARTAKEIDQLLDLEFQASHLRSLRDGLALVVGEEPAEKLGGILDGNVFDDEESR